MLGAMPVVDVIFMARLCRGKWENDYKDLVYSNIDDLKRKILNFLTKYINKQRRKKYV